MNNKENNMTNKWNGDNIILMFRTKVRLILGQRQNKNNSPRIVWFEVIYKDVVPGCLSKSIWNSKKYVGRTIV